jgi:hypothetical protein
VGRIEKAVNMVSQSKDCRFSIMTEITPNPLKYAYPVMKGVRQDVNVGFFPWDQFPIHPDLLDFLNHCSSLQTKDFDFLSYFTRFVKENPDR